ncbi:hypothetical protein HXX02_12100 [Microbulbifer elongatus]|uniref:FRG domain-containing protein n=1 Tax=Microbulbifer elongatus TaxID=86173 RepID=A0ABT1P240_9GAMM|nr:hypothetical protein [Microbulbifer elongatus]MCQ3830188.1 hypothetical protein [Microbulbifer elongatus]
MATFINSVDELETHFSKYKSGYLFRGQVKHYVDSNGFTNIPTSFSRHGCIPDVMFKWTHYAKAMIRGFSGVDYFGIDLELSQAVLQHYGWRSFYVDLTKSTAVACWFASNAYEESKSIHMSEDIHENPVWLIHKNAKYSQPEGNGHIYIIDSLALETLNIKIHDLASLQGDEGRLRFHTQQACLVGNLNDRLPPHVITSHIEVPCSVLKDYCAKNRLNDVSDVFPSSKEDFILRTLLSLPWEKMNIDSPIPTFRRGLEIPDYEDNFIKHLPPHVTLYENFWVSDNRHDSDSPFKDLIFYKLPQFSYYANTDKSFDINLVGDALERHGDFVVEIDGLIKIVEAQEEYIYEKGIHVSVNDEGYISVAGLVVSHPSNIVNSVGTNVGWIYRENNNVWERVAHQNQCPCNNTLRHQLHFSLLRMLNEAIENNEFIRETDYSYRHKNVRSA